MCEKPPYRIGAVVGWSQDYLTATGEPHQITRWGRVKNITFIGREWWCAVFPLHEYGTRITRAARIHTTMPETY